MPFARVAADLEMNHALYDYTGPRSTPATILQLLGSRESGA